MLRIRLIDKPLFRRHVGFSRTGRTSDPQPYSNFATAGRAGVADAGRASVARGRVTPDAHLHAPDEASKAVLHAERIPGVTAAERGNQTLTRLITAQRVLINAAARNCRAYVTARREPTGILRRRRSSPGSGSIGSTSACTPAAQRPPHGHLPHRVRACLRRRLRAESQGRRLRDHRRARDHPQEAPQPARRPQQPHTRPGPLPQRVAGQLPLHLYRPGRPQRRRTSSLGDTAADLRGQRKTPGASGRSSDSPRPPSSWPPWPPAGTWPPKPAPRYPRPPAPCWCPAPSRSA